MKRKSQKRKKSSYNDFQSFLVLEAFLETIFTTKKKPVIHDKKISLTPLQIIDNELKKLNVVTNALRKLVPTQRDTDLILKQLEIEKMSRIRELENLMQSQLVKKAIDKEKKYKLLKTSYDIPSDITGSERNALIDEELLNARARNTLRVKEACEKKKKFENHFLLNEPKLRSRSGRSQVSPKKQLQPEPLTANQRSVLRQKIASSIVRRS